MKNNILPSFVLSRLAEICRMDAGNDGLLTFYAPKGYLDLFLASGTIYCMMKS